MKKIVIPARDGYKLDVHLFEVENAVAVVQVIHGMEEHQERYEHFVAFLNRNGYTVVTSDLRGHGYSAASLGFFKEKKGYIELLEDQRSIRRFISEGFPGKPVFLFAHSFGTVITRVLLQTDSDKYDKVVLSGFPDFQRGAYAGILLADIIGFVKGPKYKSALLQNLSVGAFNKKIRNPKTPVDWIARNEDNVKKYIEDPFCGFGFTCSAFNDLFHLVVMMHDSGKYEHVNPDLKLLMLRGEDDPCVGGDRGAEDSIGVLMQAGFMDIHEISYPEMRHEIIAERGRDKVYADVLDFFNEKCSKAG